MTSGNKLILYFHDKVRKMICKKVFNKSSLRFSKWSRTDINVKNLLNEGATCQYVWIEPLSLFWKKLKKMSYSGHLFNGGVISCDPLFCLRKFYGDIQFFYTRIFNFSSLLKPLADLCSRDKGKKILLTHVAVSLWVNLFLFLNSSNSIHCLPVFHRGGGVRAGAQFKPGFVGSATRFKFIFGLRSKF